jgi:hypothetical protein
MTDVDGTLNDGIATVSGPVMDVIHRLEQSGVTVGLVSGRTLPELDSMSRYLGISGPVIAENGGVARLNPDSDLLPLGYTRQPALDAFEKLKSLYPGRISGRADNAERTIDVVVAATASDSTSCAAVSAASSASIPATSCTSCRRG